MKIESQRTVESNFGNLESHKVGIAANGKMFYAFVRGIYENKIRAFCLHGAFGRALKHAGYFHVKSTMEFTAKINAVEVPPSFYQDTSGWHVTLGDSDQDR